MRIGFRCRLEQHAMHDTYRIESGKKVYFFKLYRAGLRTFDEVEGETRLVHRLFERGLRVARPVANRKGNFLVELSSAEGIRHGVLFEEAPGAMIHEPDLRACAAYGRLAGAFHVAADGLAGLSLTRRLDLDHLVAEPLGELASIPWLEKKFAGELKRLGRKLEKRLSRSVARLDRGICHGDLHFGNVTARARGELTLFDFDCAGVGWRAYDLSVFLWGRAIRRPSARKLTEEWHAFLSGYRKVRELAKTDEAVIPVFAVARHLWFLGHVARSTQVHGDGWLRQTQGPWSRHLSRLVATARL
jgi:Ser/Thr protein kinase RdoA (MazF antagonist)